MSGLPDRASALALLDEWVANPGLKTHMRAVEASVRHYARKKGADEELWGRAGLLHDLDWERHPEEHPLRAVETLRDAGYPEDLLHAILAHRSEFTKVLPESDLDRTLAACDELSGFVVACCLVRPNGIDDLEPKSVLKKLKDRAFAAGVDREEVAKGPALLGLELRDHVQNVIEALRAEAATLRIRGEDVRK